MTYRDSEYLAWIRTQNCAVLDFGEGAPDCGACFDRRKIEAAHMKARRRFGDEWVLPLCPKHHQQQHDDGIASWANRHFEGGPAFVERLAEAFLKQYRGDFTALEDLR